MGSTARIGEDHLMTVEEFLATPRRAFGDAWRYELHDGVVVAQAGPSDPHAIILGNLDGMLNAQTIDSDRCTHLAGGAVVPEGKQKANARIPDALVRCGSDDDLKICMFEITSPSDEIGTTKREERRADLKSVPGAAYIVEIRQDAVAIHMHRRTVDGGWLYEDVIGLGSVLRIDEAGLSLPLRRLYRKVIKENQAERGKA
jgi:Uma2 family endonuclease